MAIKTVHIKVLSCTTNPKNHRFATTTPKFGLAKCSVTISNALYTAIPRVQTILPRHNKTGDRNREPVPLTHDAYMRPKSKITTVYHTETKPRSGHYGSRPGPAYYYRVFCRQQVHHDAGQGLSPHPETEASRNLRLVTEKSDSKQRPKHKHPSVFCTEMMPW